jgi:hypothetical protein
MATMSDAGPTGGSGPAGGSGPNPYAEALLAAVRAALPGWVVAQVHRLAIASGRGVDAALAAAARAAGETAGREVGDALARLLATDVDAQRTNPLAVLRGAVPYPTAVLRDAGVPEVVRDAFDERAFPDDVYGLAIAAWRDLGEDVHEAGIVWGAWKAQTFLARRRAEGRLG